MIGMVRLLGGPPAIPQMRDAIPRRGLFREARLQGRVLLGHIEAVEIVEEDERVIRRQERRLPGGNGRIRIVGIDGFDEDQARAMAGEIEAGQDVGFGALDIDLEKVDRRQAGIVDQRGQTSHRFRLGAVGRAILAGALGIGLHRAGQPMQSLDHVEIDACLARGPARPQ